MASVIVLIVPQTPCKLLAQGHRPRSAAVARLIPRVALSDTPSDAAMRWSVWSMDGEEDNRDWANTKPSPALTSYITPSNVLLLHQRMAMA